MCETEQTGIYPNDNVDSSHIKSTPNCAEPIYCYRSTNLEKVMDTSLPCNSNVFPIFQSEETRETMFYPASKPIQFERDEFAARFRASFIDPSSVCEDHYIAQLEEFAWQGYAGGR